MHINRIRQQEKLDRLARERAEERKRRGLHFEDLRLNHPKGSVEAHNNAIRAGIARRNVKVSLAPVKFLDGDDK